MDWQRCLERERDRYADGLARGEPAQLVRMGNAAYGAGLALLMAGEREEAGVWLERAAARWHESFASATPTSWGRPIGAIKASLLAGRPAEAAASARWALELGAETADSPIGRYAAALALLTLGAWERARGVAASLEGDAGFPADVAAALAAIAAGDDPAYAEAVASVLASFETREDYLEDVPVADTVLALAALAAKRGIEAPLPGSALLPAR
jgi:hypothetical protein